MSLFICLPDNNVTNLTNFPRHKTIRELKVNISQKTGIAVENLRFICAQNFTDDTKLNEMDLASDTKITAVQGRGKANTEIKLPTISYTLPPLAKNLEDCKNFRILCSGEKGKTHDYPLQYSSLRPFCRKCQQKTVLNPQAGSWGDIKQNKIKGFCCSCNPELFDEKNVPANASIQMYHRCSGDIYSNIKRIGLLPVTSNKTKLSVNGRNFELSSLADKNEQEKKDNERCTLAEFKKRISQHITQHIKKEVSIFFYGAETIENYALGTKIKELSPGTHIIAVHNHNNTKYLCDIRPLQPKADRITFKIRTKNNLMKNAFLTFDKTLRELKTKIGCVYSKSNTPYEGFTLYAAKPIGSNLIETKKLNEYFSTHLIVNVGSVNRCKVESHIKGSAVPMIDIVRVPVTEECPLSYENFEDGCGFRASCGHIFSIAGFYSYILTSTMKQIIAINNNPATSNSYKYLVKCPLCSDGGLTINSLRIIAKQYNTAKNWAVISDYIANGGIFCGLPSHHGDIPYFMPKNLDEGKMMIKCPTCNIEICRKHGNEWKEGFCECLPVPIESRIRKKIEAVLTKSATRSCPSCSAPILRSSDCMKMICGQVNEDGKYCGTKFCFYCGDKVPQDRPYSHYGEATPCPLFLDRHPVFSNIRGQKQTQLFQDWRAVRLLKELEKEVIQEFSKEDWELALEENKFLLARPNFDFIRELKRYPLKFNTPHALP